MINGLSLESQKSKYSDKGSKEVHAHCREEQTRNQEQIKKLKELVKSLDK